jgi:hypothetical protein
VTTKSRRRRAALRAPRAPAEVRPAEPVSDLRSLLAIADGAVRRQNRATREDLIEGIW